MAYVTPTVLKNYLAPKAKPTGAQFADLVDSTHRQAKHVFTPSPTASDQSGEIQTVLNASAAGDTFIFSQGTYNLATGLTLPDAHAVNVIGAGLDATIFRATSAMANMLFKGNTFVTGSQITDLSLECNRLANVGLRMERGKQGRFRNLKVIRHLTRGMDFGDGGVGARFYDSYFENLWIDGDTNILFANRPDYGIYLRTGATDNKWMGISVSYIKDTSVFINAGHNLFTMLHTWGGMTTGVRCSADTSLINCFVDTPDVRCVEVAGENVVLIGNHFFALTSEPWFNPNARGVYLSDFSALIMIGNRFENFAQEVDFTTAGFKLIDKPGISWGNTSSNITTPNNPLNYTTEDIFINKLGETEASYFNAFSVPGQEAGMKLGGSGAVTTRRWALFKSGSAESGGNAGSNFTINRYSDANGFLGTPLFIDRASGRTDILEGLRVAGNLGFYGTTATTQKTVTGSRGGNAALASLLTALAQYGLIIDSTTA